jgi:hypothetical protein
MRYQGCSGSSPIRIGEAVIIDSAVSNACSFQKTCGMRGELVSVTDDGYGKVMVRGTDGEYAMVVVRLHRIRPL